MTKTNNDIDNNKVHDVALSAAISYIPFFSLALINFKKDNTFMHYHARQGLVLTILCVINTVLNKLLPYIGFVFMLINLILLIVIIIGIFSALMGKKIEFPLISELAGRFVI